MKGSCLGDKPTELLEEFATADNTKRAKMVQDWSEATPIKQYLRLCHLLEVGQPLSEQDSDLVERWMNHQRSGEYLNIVLKYCLREISKENNPEKQKKLMQKFNDTFLHYTFNDEREVRGTQAKITEAAVNNPSPVVSPSKKGKKVPENQGLKTALTKEDLEALSTSSLLKMIKEDKSYYDFELAQADSSFLKKVDLENVEVASRIATVIDSLEDLVYDKSIYGVLKHWKKLERKNNKYWTLPRDIFDKLTTQQIEELDWDSDVSNDSSYQSLRFIKKYHPDLLIIGSTKETLLDKRGALRGLLKQVSKSGLKAAIYADLLLNGYEQEIYDMDDFENYLSSPIEHFNNFSDKANNSVSNKHYMYREFINYKPSISNRPNLSTVVETHVRELVKEEKNYKVLKKYFREGWLKGILITNKVLAGGDLTEYREFFGVEETERFENNKKLEFSPKTKRQFSRGEIAEIFVKVKNIGKLVCKIFHVDTAQYYLSKNKELDEKIDLDGLVPQNMLEFPFNLPKSREIEQRIVLDAVTRTDQGLFIVEVIGGALSCRMIIRKGALQLLPFHHFSGVGFYIIDEAKKVCRGEGTGVIVDGQFHPATMEGQVVFPYSKETIVKNKQIILVHRGFSYLSTIDIPKEDYSLRSAVIFHEEGLVNDQINRLIIRNKVYLNGSPITLAIAGSCDVTIEAKNFAELTSHKELRGLHLSDTEDLVISYPVPKLLSHLQVTVSMSIKDSRGQTVNLKQVHQVMVDRNLGQDRFCSVHLRRGGAQGNDYSIAVLGKNGEPIVAHRIEVQLLKVYGPYDYSQFLYTDRNGVATLGQIDDFKFIDVICPQKLFKKRRFVLSTDVESMDIPSLIEMCVGEKLLLPSLGKKLNRETFEFFKRGVHPHSQQSGNLIILSDCFDQLKTELSAITAQNLSKGEYLFRYNLYPAFEVRIVVHEGSRWSGNPYILENSRSLIELKPESRYLSVNKIYRAKESPLTINLNLSSNNPSSVRAHILGYSHHPSLSSLSSSTLLETCPQFSSVLTSLPYMQNTLLGNRVFSDEHNYCLERKLKEKLVGNTLDKPSILLHRDKVRETKDEEEVLRGGKGFDDDKKLAQVEQELVAKCMNKSISRQIYRGEMMDDIMNQKCDVMMESAVFFKKAKKQQSAFGGLLSGIGKIFSKDEVFTGVDYASRKRYEIRSAVEPDSFCVDNNMDFSRGCGKMLENLKPSSTGEIQIDLREFKNCSILQVFVCDINSTVMITLPIGESVLEKRDMRVERALEAGAIWKLDYSMLVPEKNRASQWRIEETNLSNAQALTLDSVEALKDALFTVASDSINKAELTKWSFISKWHQLSVEEKLDNWDKFGSHELSIFLIVRDLSFFTGYIQPMLEHKAKQTFIDKLIQQVGKNELSPSFPDMPPAFDLSLLSPVEIFLIIYLSPESEVAKRLIDSITVKYANAGLGEFEKKRKIYDSVLNQEAQDKTLVDDSISKRTKNIGKESSGEDADGIPPKDAGELSRAAESKDRKKMRAQKIAPDSPRLGKEEEPLGDMLMDERTEGKINIPSNGLIPITKAEREDILIEEYQKAPKAFEFMERQDYFKGELLKLKLNPFWVGLLTNLAKRKSQPLSIDLEWLEFSEECLLMNNSCAEVIMALTFTKVPLEKGRISSHDQTSRSVSVASSSPFLVLVKSTKVDTDSLPLELELVVSQKFYDPADKFTYDDKDPSIYSVKEVKEFLTAKIYESRVSMTNLSENNYQVWLITQVPEGALPVNCLEDFKIQRKDVGPMQTVFFNFKFYFPSVGSFKVYPATLMRNNRFVACAKLKGGSLSVVEEYSPQNKPLETLQDLVTFGGSEDILRFLGEKNMFNTRVFDLDKIRWVAKTSKEAFRQLISLLKVNFYFDERIWSYAIYHGSYPEFLELLSVIMHRFVQCCQYLDLGKGLVIENFEPLEYDPLVNPRAHEMREKGADIRNPDFRATYQRFLIYCCEKGSLSFDDKVTLLGYWILQDRIPESLTLFRSLQGSPSAVVSVQFDYIRAYLSMYTEQPDYPTARSLSQEYADFADISWRDRFLKIDHQLKEYDAGRALDKQQETITPHQVKIQSNLVQAELAEFLKLERSGKTGLSVTHRNIDRLRIKFFRFDMELLFSKDPFLESQGQGIAAVSPNHELKFRVLPSQEFKTNIIQIPEHLANEYILVQVSSKDKTEVLQVANSSLSLHPRPEFGILEVFTLQGLPLSGCYVKTYYKTATGKISFHKDGYTDFRGSFDYVSLNSDGLGDIQEFSLLAVHPSYGSCTARAKPPITTGRVIRASEASADFRELYEDAFFVPDTTGTIE